MAIMQLVDFQDVIILAATFYMAFVAVDYVKSFSSLLYEKVFRLPDFIEEQIARAEKLSIDTESLKNFANHEIDGRNLVERVEQVRRTNEILNGEIATLKTSYTQSLTTACMSKNIQAVCLFMFLTCLTALIASGLEGTWPIFTHAAWILYSFFALAYLSLTAIPSCSSKLASFNVMLLSYGIMFFITLCLSILFQIVSFDFFDTWWAFWLPISVFVLWVCFFFIIISIFSQVKQKKSQLQKDVEIILNKEEYSQMLQLYQRLQSVGELASIG